MRHCSRVVLSLLFLLSGCAGTIRSEVTAFHEWPDHERPVELRDKSFTFERSRDQENNLEHRAYENLVRAELLRLGFVDAADPRAARLKVSTRYGMSVRDLRVIEPVLVDSWYGPRWHRYGPFYDPFWPGVPVVMQRDVTYQVFTRQLQVTLAQPDGRKLFEVTVRSEGSNGSLPAVMPYLVRSAFNEFPGKSGVPRVVTQKMEQ
jgi:hypothetical protein